MRFCVIVVWCRDSEQQCLSGDSKKKKKKIEKNSILLIELLTLNEDDVISWCERCQPTVVFQLGRMRIGRWRVVVDEFARHRRRAGADGKSVRPVLVAADALAVEQDAAGRLPRRLSGRHRRRDAGDGPRRQRRELERRTEERIGRHEESRGQVQRFEVHRKIRKRYFFLHFNFNFEKKNLNFFFIN